MLTRLLDRKFKLSNDPNNTKWSKNTTSFGHKIMIEQGWAPGQFLGAQDAPHAEFHTEANASHIRVVLKDDNLGIGAKKGSGVNQGECVGLDVFQTLLGRLNSTDEEEYVKEQNRREDLKRAIYTEQKWGTIRFVHGGFLIGDKIQDLIDGEKERVKNLKMAESDSDSSSSDSDSDSDEDEEEKPKKTIEVETAKLTLDTKSKKRKSEDDDKDKAAKKAKKAAEKVDRKAQKTAEKDDDSKLSKKERKQKRKERKAAKEKRRAEKAAKKEAKASTKKDGKKDKKRSRDESSSSAVPTPPVSGTSTPRPILQSGRLAVRARNIEAKRMAAMHGTSINEVCDNFSWAVH